MRVAQVDVAIISVGTRGLAAYRAARAAGDTDRNGVVWLSGTANSQQEADKAVELRATPRASNQSTANSKSGKTAKGRFEPRDKETRC